MATGGAPQLRNSASEPRGSRGIGNGAPSRVDDIFRFNLIGEEDKPNNYWNWKPSSTFAAPSSEPQPKKSKTKNKDRDRRAMASPKENHTYAATAKTTPAQGSRDKRRHTPATYPRTQFVGTDRERAELETLRQELTFSDMDEKSVDSQVRGASGVSGMAANNARSKDAVKRPHSSLMNGALSVLGLPDHHDKSTGAATSAAIANRSRNTTASSDSNLVNEMPDRNQIVARLMQIRDYIKQASAMMTNLERNTTGSLAGDEQVEKLLRLREHLQDQEKGYLALLERMLAEETGDAELHLPLDSGRASHNSQNSGESFASSAARSTSINLDARSDISEATTEGTFTARTRPRIESHLGFNTASENEYESGSEDGRQDFDTRSMSSQASTGMISGLDTQELHEQFSAMLRKYQAGVEDFEASTATETEDEEMVSRQQVKVKGPRGIPEGSTTDTTEDDADKRIEELTGLRQQHDLLKTMLQQQEELRALQSRQEALMKLQQDIEGRLHHSEQAKGETTEDTESQSTMHSLPSQQQDMDSTLKASASVVPVGDEGMTQQRRDVLMSLLAEDRDRRGMELEQARTLDKIAHQEAELTAMSEQRQSLQDKVEALQKKKHQMDSLLNQFQDLRPILGPSEGDAEESSVASSTNVNEVPRIVGSPGGDATQQTEEEAEARDKLLRLQEVHHRLNELKDLVQQYQGIEGEVSEELPPMSNGVGGGGRAATSAAVANYEDPQLMSNLRYRVLDELIQEYQGTGGNGDEQPASNIRKLEGRRQTDRYPTQNSTIKTEESESQLQTEEDDDETTTENATTEDDAESTQSSILALWGDDPEIREKVRKLQAAKMKLRQLQDLVSMVQQTPEVMNMLPDDLAELALSFDEFSEQLEDDEDEEEENKDEEEGENTTSEMSEGEVPPPVSRQTREAYFEAKMQQQRNELEKLVDERHRLLSVQDQLRELNQRLPKAATTPPVPKTQANTNTAKTQNTERNSKNPRTVQQQHPRPTPAGAAISAPPANRPMTVPTPASRPMTVPTPASRPMTMPPPVNRQPVNSRPMSMPPGRQMMSDATATPTREEVMKEMMKHRRLQMELQQKKEELSALLERVKGNNREIDSHSELTYSVTSEMGDNDNDLFSRVSMRSADVTAAGTWGGSTQISDDDDDEEYPSDGIIQVEEEEEQDGTSIAGTADTYTIEADYINGLGRQRMPRETDEDFDALHGVHYPKWSPRMAYGVRRQENVRSAEELMAESGRGRVGGYNQPREVPTPAADPMAWQVQQLQNQLSNSMGMCQALIRDQQSMSGLLQTSMSGGYGMAATPQPSSLPTPPPGSDPHYQQMVNDYNLRLQQQQLQLNLNTAYNQLYNQQQDIHRMYERLQGNTGPSSIADSERDGSINNLNNNRTGYGNPYASYASPYNSMPQPNVGPQYGQSSGYPFSVNPTFPPNFSSLPTPAQSNKPAAPTPASNQYNPSNNTTADGQREYDAYARYRVDRENYEGEDYHMPPNTAAGSVDHDSVDHEYRRQERENLMMPTATYPGLADLYRLDFTNQGASDVSPASRMAANVPREERDNIPPIDIRSLLKKSEKQRRRREMAVPESPAVPPLRDPRAIQDEPIPKRGKAAGAKAKLAAHSKRSPKYAWGPRPGLSGAISGTAFLDTASLASTMSFSSMPGDLSGPNTPKQPDSHRSINSMKSTSEMESDAGSEFSLFEALRESIYSEVATLISQNEARPHFLIELFRELQMLTTDYLRQRALYALQDLVSKFLTEDSVRTAPRPAAVSMNALGPQHPRAAWQMSASEHTPSESYMTSEDEEMKAQLYGQSSRKHNKGKKSIAKAEHESLASDQYDYMENIESASEISTPPSTGPGDFGFANDELGDTVIHLDKALQRMREYERMKAEAEAAANSGAVAVDLKDDEMVDATSTDVTSNSSAQDMGSESSFSDMPYPRIDTRQLDLQIKSIMQEVIPYLKEHMDDVCSPQLLSYIRRLVLTLARQRDDSREFVRFFNRQLGSILQDSLAKFSGRKMRECGEDLLVDISEILFNELAFFRLMQDLDTSGGKMQKEEEEEEDEEDEDEEGDGATETATETETGQEDATEEESSSEEEDELEDDNTPAPQQLHGKRPLTVTALAAAAEVTPDEQEAIESFMNDASQKEEEDLGKNRDDAMAGRVDIEISDRDEDSEAMADKDQVKIALSMSESIAVTYLGSGEEDDDLDSVSECVDETITSMGAAGAVDEETEPESQVRVSSEEDDDLDSVSECVDETITSMGAAGAVDEETEPESQQTEDDDTAHPPSPPHINGEMGEDEGEETPEEEHQEETATSVAKETKEEGEKSDNASSSVKEVNGDEEKEKAEDVDEEGSKNGGVDANDNEVTVDDLPTKGLMTSLSQVELEMKISEEQANNSTAKAAIEAIPSGEGELAGDPLALKDPTDSTADGPALQDGVVSAGGDIGSE